MQGLGPELRARLDAVPPEAIAEYLADRIPAAGQLLEALRPALNGRPIVPLVEYLAERLSADHGERQVTFELSNGKLRRARLGHAPIGNVELEQIART